MLSPENSKTLRVKCKLQDVVNTHDECGMTAFKECAKETIRQRLFSLWPVSCNQKQVEGLQVAICGTPATVCGKPLWTGGAKWDNLCLAKSQLR